MKYYVYNENNARVLVTDEQLDDVAKKDGKELRMEFVVAMGASHNNKYISKLYEALYHPEKKIRIEAIYSILSLSENDSIQILEKKEKNLGEEDFNTLISEKAILQSVIIRLKYGPNGAEKAFFDEECNHIVKCGLLYNYSSNMILMFQDVIFIINALDAYVNKSEQWIKNLNREDYEDAIIKGLEGLLKAADESLFLNELPDEANNKLVNVCKIILNMKIESYAKEVIATFSKALRPKVAYDLLQPIMNGRARGDVKKELQNSLSILKQKEMEGESEY